MVNDIKWNAPNNARILTDWWDNYGERVPYVCTNNHHEVQVDICAICQTLTDLGLIKDWRIYNTENVGKDVVIWDCGLRITAFNVKGWSLDQFAAKLESTCGIHRKYVFAVYLKLISEFQLEFAKYVEISNYKDVLAELNSKI